MKWHIRQDQFAVITQNAPLVMSGPNPPDLMRMPQISGLVHDHLLKNMDRYFKQYGWKKFPASQLVADADGRRTAGRAASARCGRWDSTTA